MQLAIDFLICVVALVALNSALAALLDSLTIFYRVLAIEILMAFAYAAFLVRQIRMEPSRSLKYSRCYRYNGGMKADVK
jgi:hypothetical protein